MPPKFKKDLQYYKFCLYGFLKNQRFFEPFFILILHDEKGLNYALIGTIYAIIKITRNIFEIPSGILADSLGRRKTMMTSFAFYILSFVFYYFSNGFFMLVIASFVFGTADAFRTGTHKAMIFQYLKIKHWEDQKVHYYGHTRSWSQLGSAISSLIAAAIVFFSGSFSSVFLLSLVPYSIDFFLMASYPVILEGESLNRRNEKVMEVFKKVFYEFVFSFKNIKLLKAITNMSSYSGYYQAVKDYFQTVIQAFVVGIPIFMALESRKKEAIVIGMIYFILYFITFFTSRNSGRVADKFDHLSKPLNVTLIIGLISGLLIGVFYKLNLLAVSIFVFFFVYIIENLRRPMAVSYITELLNDDVLASVLSAESQANTIFAALIAPLFGIIAQFFGIEMSFILTSLVLLVFSPFYMINKTDRKGTNI